MRSALYLAIGALPGALAVCSSSANYVVIPSFVSPGNCVPGGYAQAQDLGNTNPSDLVSRCEARCTSLGSQCVAFVGQLFKAADSNLYSGQCFFYSSTPTPFTPRKCADGPSQILAEQKDTIANCFSSSSVAASAYCSSYLSIGTVTTYISTTTPVSTLTTPSTTTAFSTSVSISVTSTTTTSISTILTTVATTTTTTSVSTSVSVNETPIVSAAKRAVVRQAVVPAPACVPSFEPTANIKSACSCLNIPKTTVSLVSTAPATTTTKASAVTQTSITTTTTLTTSISTLRTTTTTTTSSVSTTIQQSTTTTTTVDPAAETLYCNIAGIEKDQPFRFNPDQVSTDDKTACRIKCRDAAFCGSSGFYIRIDPMTGESINVCRLYMYNTQFTANTANGGFIRFSDKYCPIP